MKGVNSPLTYAVKDLSLDLHVFPEYDGSDVKFVTAGSGETGSSKISLSLGSITDRQIRETSKKPVSGDNIAIDEIDEIDEETKKQLGKLGVRSAEDIEKLNEKNIKVTKTVKAEKAGGTGTTNSSIDFKKLAGLINKAQRSKKPPRVFGAQMGNVRGRKVIAIKGENLAFSNTDTLKAKLNDQDLKVLGATGEHIVIELSETPIKQVNQLEVRLDDYTAFTLNINAKQPRDDDKKQTKEFNGNS